jgi:cytidine deaminase
MERAGESWSDLAELAWRAREAAFVFDQVKVGCAVLSAAGRLFSGCNVEHRFRSHDVHAEVNAITSMVTAGERGIAAILVVAEKELYTPCGACMDWVLQFGGPACRVGYQSRRGGDVSSWSAGELMPFYPRER